MFSKLILALSATIAISGCASYSGATVVAIKTEVSAPRGYSLAKPVAIQTADGTRFHGSVCRQSISPPPDQIRLDRLDSNGAVIASTTHRLSGLQGRNALCTYYDVNTLWTISSGERVRACAVRTESSCPPPE